MANGTFININYPFKDSKRGFFLEMNDNDNNAVKADLMHLILTTRGERLYMPDFGTNLLKHIFNPNDGITHSEISIEMKETVKKYLPNLTINEVKIDPSTTNEYAATIRIDYTVTDDVFESTDFVIIQI